jgi:hypothetical protein
VERTANAAGISLVELLRHEQNIGIVVALPMTSADDATEFTWSE